MSRLERVTTVGGVGAIVAGITEDSKVIAAGGIAALITLGLHKFRNRRSGSTEQLQETSFQTEGGRAEGPFGTKAFDIQRTSLSQPNTLLYTRDDNDKATDQADQEPEYPVGLHLSSDRLDTAEKLEAIERFLGPSFDDDIADIRNEANLYHGTPDWNINVDTHNEAREILEELEHSGSLPQSALPNIDAMQARLGFEKDESDEYDNDNNSNDGYEDGDSNGDYGNGDVNGNGNGGDGGDGGGE